MKIDPIEYDLLIHTLQKQQKEIKNLENKLCLFSFFCV